MRCAGAISPLVPCSRKGPTLDSFCAVAEQSRAFSRARSLRRVGKWPSTKTSAARVWYPRPALPVRRRKLRQNRPYLPAQCHKNSLDAIAQPEARHGLDGTNMICYAIDAFSQDQGTAPSDAPAQNSESVYSICATNNNPRSVDLWCCWAPAGQIARTERPRVHA